MGFFICPNGQERRKKMKICWLCGYVITPSMVDAGTTFTYEKNGKKHSHKVHSSCLVSHLQNKLYIKNLVIKER
jgi:hypothetical protein